MSCAQVQLRALVMHRATTEQIETRFLEGSRVGESELQYRQAELVEFYGPIYTRLKVTEELYVMFMRQELKEINL
jgi:hypothetical protein